MNELSRENLLHLLRDMREAAEKVAGGPEELERMIRMTENAEDESGVEAVMAELRDSAIIQRVMERQMEILTSRLAGHGADAEDDEDDEDDDTEWSDDDDEDDEEDEDDEDEEEDDDEDDDEDDEDDEDEDDEEEKPRRKPRDLSVVLERDFRSRRQYVSCVRRAIEDQLHKLGVSMFSHQVKEGVYVFMGERSFGGDDVRVNVLLEEKNCNIRIEYILPYELRRGRGPYIDYEMMERDFPLKYGKLIRDHDDDEMKLEHSFCFDGAFTQESFAHYWMLMGATMRAYYTDLRRCAGKKLTEKQVETIRKMIAELKSALPKKPKADKPVEGELI